MGKLAAAIAATTKPRLIAWGDLVYRVIRVDSDDLRRVGFATLEGAASVREVDVRLREVQRQTRAKVSKLKPEEAEAELAKAKEREAALAEDRLVALLGRAEAQVAVLDRYDAYICSAITGVGRLLDTTERHPLGVVVDVSYEDRATVLEDLRDEAEVGAGAEPIYIEQIRFVQSEKDHDPDKGRVWVHSLNEEQRRLLGTAIAVLQSVAGDLVPFRLQPRAPADPGEAGDPIQQATARDPGPGTGGSGAGDHVPRSLGGKRGRKNRAK